MGARKKLNAMYFTIATGIALLLGGLFQSSAVFAVCFIGLIAALMHDGSIRPRRHR